MTYKMQTLELQIISAYNWKLEVIEKSSIALI